MSGLSAFARFIDGLNDRIGRVTAWLALLMVVVQFVLVITRYVYGVSSIFIQESVVYMHALLFMVAAGYTLRHDGHVRVDIFYREAAPRRKALVNLLGSLFFLMPVCVLIWWKSWPYVANSWSYLEGSRETSGIQAVFLLKSVILLFVALVGLQGVAQAIHSLAILVGREPLIEEEHPKL